MRLDITKLTLAADTLLTSTTHPLHRAILLNYRRHAMLEVSGRYDEIFTPDMTVDVPHYKIFHLSEEILCQEFVGAQVKDELYKGLTDRGITVMMLEHERLSLADWGFASEALFHFYTPGSALAGVKHPAVDDPEAMYDVYRWNSMHWTYDHRGRLMGEHVYQGPVAGITKLQADEVWHVDEVRDVLSRIINEPAPLKAS
jgi:hypothetical protein